MIDAFSKLSETDLRALISALQARRITPPYSVLQVSRVLGGSLSSVVSGGLQSLDSRGFGTDQIMVVLELLATDRLAAREGDAGVELVTSGPDAPGICNRDTSVVVRELFANALNSVLVVGYAVYQGAHVFEALAQRMEQIPELKVQFYLDISRKRGETTRAEIIVSRFTEHFKSSQWPSGGRLPEVYFDPRSLDEHHTKRSSLHAKCVVIDSEKVFVSSANFTEAAQQRNIEVGICIQNPRVAQQLSHHFSELRNHKVLVRAL